MDKENQNTKKKNFTKNQLTSDQQTELENKKKFLHNLIDSISAADYVEANTRLLDIAGGTTQTIHQILIEKNGNITVRHKGDIPRCFGLDDDDDL